jgi:E1A-binding protein p400
MTVEENILKKANQKRLLGDLAIEGGNFTTAYFKSVSVCSHSSCLVSDLKWSAALHIRE